MIELFTSNKDKIDLERLRSLKALSILKYNDIEMALYYHKEIRKIKKR